MKIRARARKRPFGKESRARCPAYIEACGFF
jgi:hypothetical protein